MDNYQISNGEIVHLLLDYNNDVDAVVDVVSINNNFIKKDDLKVFKNYLIKTFKPRFNQRWISASRNRIFFFEKNKAWADKFYTFGDLPEDGVEPCSSRGRPTKSYEDLGPRAKKNKINELCSNVSAELITCAAKKICHEEKIINKFSPEEALSLILDAHLSKNQYELMRNAAKNIGSDIFPPYHQVLL